MRTAGVDVEGVVNDASGVVGIPLAVNSEELFAAICGCWPLICLLVLV